MEWKQGEFTVTDRQEDLDIEIIHNFTKRLKTDREYARLIRSSLAATALSLDATSHAGLS